MNYQELILPKGFVLYYPSDKPFIEESKYNKIIILYDVYFLPLSFQKIVLYLHYVSINSLYFIHQKEMQIIL